MKFVATLATLFAMAVSAKADDYVVIVFDTSGSMAEHMRSAKKTRLRVAQEALVSVLSQVPNTTKVGVLTFQGWSYDIADVNQATLNKAILATRADGGTPLYRYIKDAGTRLLQERERRGNIGYYKMIVVTDGEAQDSNLNEDHTWNDGSAKSGVLREVMSRGIVVDAIGLEVKGGHSLRTQINGTYMDGNDPASIQQSLKRAVAEVGFNGNDALSQTAFDTVADMPDNFVKASLKGLTDFQNHPIGEKAPIKVVKENGATVMQADPDKPKDEGGIGLMGWLLIIIGFFVILLIIGTVRNT
jgi:uncharacterized protein YegL